MAELTETSSSASKFESSSFYVFLSFRGEDTRNNFTSFLHKDLKNKGIDVFLDRKDLWTGEAIGPALSRAIEGSKIWIPVLSRGYAYSKWCLGELAQIVQCHRSNGQLILPIFFYVDPSHVRHQTGSFEEAFKEHEKKFNPEIVKSWRDALKFVGNLKGVVVDENGDQAELVESIVKMVLGELTSTTPLAECKYPIGLDSRTNDMISLLDISSNDVQFVGICGDIGIGKTTIAKAVYNRLLFTFKRHSFLLDIREQVTQCMDIVSLQKQLLKDIFQIDHEISDYHTGKTLIERKLCKEKILVVLDDVDNQEQLDALAGDINWFGQGSRIIITTRDQHILNVAKVARDKIYRPRMLDGKQSLQLLCKHAFSMDQPPEDLMQFSHDVAYYLGGLPINLEVLGPYLSDRRIKAAWESIFQKLNEIPQEQVYRKLKTTYDDLEDDCLKAPFPDFKWHFIEWENETVSSIWERSSYCQKSVIRNFMKSSLPKDEESAKYTLRMHDHQIRDTGKEIVREERLVEPGRHGKSLSYGDILEVLTRHEGTGMIGGMSLPDAFASEPFQMMPKLRFPDKSTSSASVWGDLLQSSALRGSEGRQGLRTWNRRDRLELTPFQSRVRSARIGLNWPKRPQKMATWGAAWNRHPPIWIQPCRADPDLIINPAGRSYPWFFLPETFYRKRRDYLDYWLTNMKQVLNFQTQDENKGFQTVRVIDLTTRGSSFRLVDSSRCESLEEIPESIGQLVELSCMGSLILFLVLEFPSHCFGYHFETIDLDVLLSVHRKDKSTRFHYTLRIEVDAKVTHPHLIHIHRSKGFEWFGIPLQGDENFELLDIYNNSTHKSDPIVKFWKIFFKKEEPNQPKPDLHSSAMMLAHIFNRVCVDSNCSPQPVSVGFSIHKAMSSRAGKRACYDEAACDTMDTDEAAGPETSYNMGPRRGIRNRKRPGFLDNYM